MADRFHRLLPIVLGLAVLAAFASSHPGSASASTETSMASRVLSALNSDRAAMGLRALRVDSRLKGLAGDRAAWMASTGILTHQSYGGEIGAAVRERRVAAYSSGEAVGSTNAAWGTAAIDYLYVLWKASPDHWALMTSSTFNYIGVGLSYREDGAQTFASLVFAEAPDSSRPMVAMTGAGLSGHTATFSWTGRDGLLQTHTAGLRDFDVQYRVDAGAWALVRSHTNTTQLVLRNRASRHSYSVRIRDRDGRNNLSGWTPPRTVRVP